MKYRIVEEFKNNGESLFTPQVNYEEKTTSKWERLHMLLFNNTRELTSLQDFKDAIAKYHGELIDKERGKEIHSIDLD